MLSYDDFDSLIRSVGLEGSKEQETLLSLFATLASSELTKEQAQQVLEIFSLEGLQELQNTPDKVLNATWRDDFDYGNVKVGDYVRVKKGSYAESTSGVQHEGRIGILISVLNYRCTVRYIGLHSGNRMIHPMKNLESMKRGN